MIKKNNINNFINSIKNIKKVLSVVILGKTIAFSGAKK